MNNNLLLKIIAGLAVYLLFAGGSYFVFSKTSIGQNVGGSSYKPPTTQNGQAMFDPNLPKTQVCPLNGAKYSKQQEDWYLKHRPLGVMIENTPDARPQSGISSSDVVYEAVAEGGITRFFVEFYCQDPGEVGPVRSARTYFLDYASEYGDHPLYTHVGGANKEGPANALGQIDDYGWGNYNDLNQFSVGYPVFWRDYNRTGINVATEHTMYTSAQKLWDYAEKSRGLSATDKDGVSWKEGFVEYSFKDDVAASSRPTSQTMHLEMWSSDPNYFVDWKYNPQTNNYMRSVGGKPHMDKDNGVQLSAKNVVVLFEKQSVANDGYEDGQHLLYGDKGTGKAVVFQNGKEIQATWSKASRTSRTELTDSNGNPISFVRGRMWFEILPLDGVLSVK